MLSCIVLVFSIHGLDTDVILERFNDCPEVGMNIWEQLNKLCGFQNIITVTFVLDVELDVKESFHSGGLIVHMSTSNVGLHATLKQR